LIGSTGAGEHLLTSVLLCWSFCRREPSFNTIPLLGRQPKILPLSVIKTTDNQVFTCFNNNWLGAKQIISLFCLIV
jgi:hypothetical protein